MKGYDTMSRDQAVLMLWAAKSVTYFFQMAGGTRYTRDVTLADFVKAFRANASMQLRTRLEDSGYFVYSTKNRKQECGYQVLF